MKEIWKDIQGYEGLYMISNYGNVKSLGNNKSRKEKILNPRTNTKGYKQIALCKNNKRKYYSIHKLVALHFIPNPNNLSEINHKDENKNNNSIENLEYCDHKYNMNYGTRTERARNKTKGREGLKGEKNPTSKKVKCLNTGEIFSTVSDAAEWSGLRRDSCTISAQIQGKRKTAGKHPVTGERLKWQYVK